VIRRTAYHNETLPGVTTAADGTFAIADPSPFAADITYDVAWDGSADIRWSKASVTVSVQSPPSGEASHNATSREGQE
jgi:hypothetical protein